MNNSVLRVYRWQLWVDSITHLPLENIQLHSTPEEDKTLIGRRVIYHILSLEFPFLIKCGRPKSVHAAIPVGEEDTPVVIRRTGTWPAGKRVSVFQASWSNIHDIQAHVVAAKERCSVINKGRKTDRCIGSGHCSFRPVLPEYQSGINNRIRFELKNLYYHYIQVSTYLGLLNDKNHCLVFYF